MKKPRRKSRAEWEIAINKRARKDPAFKKRLLANPKATLKALGCTTGLNPEKVRIIEETDNTQIIVLHRVPLVTHPISQEELRQVSAGCTDAHTWTEVSTCHEHKAASIRPDHLCVACD